VIFDIRIANLFINGQPSTLGETTMENKLDIEEALQAYDKHVEEHTNDIQKTLYLSCDKPNIQPVYNSINAAEMHRSRSIQTMTFIGLNDAYLAVALTNGTVQIWDASASRLCYSWDTAVTLITKLVPIGQYYLGCVTSGTYPMIYIFNWHSQRCVNRFNTPRGVKPFGDRYFISDHLYDVTKQDPLLSLHVGTGITHIEFLPERKLLVCIGTEIRTYDLMKLKNEVIYKDQYRYNKAYYENMQLIDDNHVLFDDGILELDTKKLVLKNSEFTEVHHFGGDYGVKLSWGSVQILNCKTGKNKQELEISCTRYSCAMSTLRGQLAVPTEFGYIFIYQLFIGQSKDVQRLTRGLFERREKFCDLLIKI
jgi:WD40 repeat protein